MQCVVLAGGEATRLPGKLLIELHGRPLVSWIIDSWLEKGVSDFVFCINEADAELRSVVCMQLNGHVRFLLEQERLGTGGWLHLFKELGERERSERFLVVCGDILTDVDVPTFVESCTGAVSTMLVPVPELSSYGRVKLDEKFVREYLPRKAVLKEAGLIVSGVFTFTPQIFDFLPDHRAFSLEECLREAAAVGKNTFFVHDGFWLDVGTPERLQGAQVYIGKFASG